MQELITHPQSVDIPALLQDLYFIKPEKPLSKEHKHAALVNTSILAETLLPNNIEGAKYLIHYFITHGVMKDQTYPFRENHLLLTDPNQWRDMLREDMIDDLLRNKEGEVNDIALNQIIDHIQMTWTLIMNDWKTMNE